MCRRNKPSLQIPCLLTQISDFPTEMIMWKAVEMFRRVSEYFVVIHKYIQKTKKKMYIINIFRRKRGAGQSTYFIKPNLKNILTISFSSRQRTKELQRKPFKNVVFLEDHSQKTLRFFPPPIQTLSYIKA